MTFILPISTTGSVDLTSGDETSVSVIELQIEGLTGSITPRARLVLEGAGTPGSYADYPYYDCIAQSSVAAGTPITADGLYEIECNGKQVALNVGSVTGTVNVKVKPLIGPGVVVGGGGGGGGGGAVTIANGADVTQGSIADAAVTGDGSGTVNAHLRGLTKVSGDPTDVAVTGDASGTMNAHLRGLTKTLGDVWDATNHRLYTIQTDGTHFMPTMDAIARKGFQQLTDGTTAVGVDATSTGLKMAFAADLTPAPTSPLQVALFDPTLARQQSVLTASTAAVATDIPAVVALHPSTPARIGDGTNTVGTSAASTAVAAATPALAVGLSPNSPLPAGENSIGIIGGHTTVLKPTCTVSTSPAYTSGDDAGGKITIANAVRVSGGTGVFQSLQLFFKSGTAPTGVFLLFDADPTAATITDNTAFAWSTDQAKCIACIPIVAANLTTVASQIVATASFTPFDVKAASGTSLYAAYVLTSTPTFTATTDMLCAVGILQD